MPKKEKDSKSSNFRGSLKENFFKYVGSRLYFQRCFQYYIKLCTYLSTYMCETDHVSITICMHLGKYLYLLSTIVYGHMII